MGERLIFHVDVNSAFLSWEAARRVREGLPDLRLIPSAVGGDPKSRIGIITAKSIPAKKFGVTTGEPVSNALKKCPELVLVRSDFELYRKCSHAFKEICQSYAPVMESFSIDEVFLDFTGTGLIYPDPLKLAYEIKDRIRDELGFTVNVGIGSNKLLAKTASDFEKPDKVHTLYKEEIPQKFWPLPAGDLLFLGKSSAARLSQTGIHTIGALAHTPESDLKKLFGEKQAAYLHRAANGIDDSPVSDAADAAKGYSMETSFDADVVSYEQAYRILLNQADALGRRMRREGNLCSCVNVYYRTTAFKNRSHQTRLYDPTDVTDEIHETAKKLFRESWNGEPLRLVGLQLSGLTTDEFSQFSLFESAGKHEKKRKLDQAMDAIRDKYGKNAVKRASTIDPKPKSEE